VIDRCKALTCQVLHCCATIAWPEIEKVACVRFKMKQTSISLHSLAGRCKNLLDTLRSAAHDTNKPSLSIASRGSESHDRARLPLSSLAEIEKCDTGSTVRPCNWALMAFKRLGRIANAPRIKLRAFCSGRARCWRRETSKFLCFLILKF
jgi:hypothetical protein